MADGPIKDISQSLGEYLPDEEFSRRVNPALEMLRKSLEGKMRTVCFPVEGASKIAGDDSV